MPPLRVTIRGTLNLPLEKKLLAKVNTTQMQIKIKVSAKQIPWFIVDALMRGLLDTLPSIQVCAKINKILHLSMLCIYSIIAMQIHRFPLKSAEMWMAKYFNMY